MSSETEPLPSMEEGEEEVVPDNGNGTYYVGHFSFSLLNRETYFNESALII